MNVTLNLNKDFERTLEQLKTKYGEKFEYLNGLHESQLDNATFFKNFIKSDVVADATIDPNANSSHKDIRSYMAEKNKPQDKMSGLSDIFAQVSNDWGLDVAKEWLEAEYNRAFYLNDAATSTSLMPYCWANDVTRLATEGLFFVNNYNNQAPKHLTTYFDDIIELISFLANRQSGAVGLPNVLIWAYYFWKHDVENDYYLKNPDYYLRQCFQKFIYRLNQPFIRIDQSAFTNVSIFDREYLEALFGGVEFPDGSLAIEQIEEMMQCQRVFMEVVSSIREEQLFTFPVITISLLYQDGKFVDEETARWASKHNIKWMDSNFFCADNVGTLSNCPVSGDTKILYWSDRYNKFNLSPIKDVYFNIGRKDENRQIDVISNGNIIKCKINKFSEPADYLITLTNGASLRTTGHHLNKVYGKDYVETKDLTTDDYLPYSTKEYKSNDYLTFEEGKIVGMFLGDGSYRNNSEITFSLNADTDKEDIEFLESYCSKHFGAKFNYTECVSALTGKKKCVNVNVNSSYMRGLINQFVHGRNALEKELDLSVLNCSSDFRRGIVEGLYTTDGNKSSENCNRIYTSSSKLIDSLVVLFSSLGIVTKLYEDSRDGRLGKNPNYTLRWFAPNGRTKRKDSYILDENYMWVKIKSIEKLSSVRGGSYCLEVIDGSEPVFMLGNGIVTHNCRLLSQVDKLDAFINSIGGTALSVGSARVNTINLVRIAYESGFNRKKYIELLRERVLLDCKVLNSIRNILKRNIDAGLMPNYQDGALDLSKQFMTIGGM